MIMKSQGFLEREYHPLNERGIIKTTILGFMEMVNIKLPAIANKYKFLMDSSFIARYNNYNVDILQSKLCQKFLKEIKEYCYP